jgi:hypothetical protein
MGGYKKIVSPAMRDPGNVEHLVLDNAIYLPPLLLPATQNGQQLFQVLKTLTINDE